MRELLPDVFTWSWYSEPHGYDFNGWLVRHPDGNVAIDPVEPSDEALSQIAAFGVSRVVLTNRNHVRASGRLRDATGARVAIHPADRAYAEAQGAIIDDVLVVGERVGPLVVVDASGKSPGEVALHWPERGILFVGDACVGNPPGACSLLPDRVIGDRPALVRSLTRIVREVPFEVLLVGDGVPLLTGAQEALQALVATLGCGLRGARPMAFVATCDPGRARAFYEGVLGLRCVADEPYALVFDLAGTTLRVQKVRELSPHPFTALGWQVDDVAVVVAELGARGVVFERFAFLEQDPSGVWSAPDGARVAWFKDPDGNVLSLTSCP